MFTNIGAKLKIWAKVIFVVLCIIGGLLSLALALYIGNTVKEGGIVLAIPVALVSFAVFLFGAWCTVAILYAFGELVQNSSEMNEKMDVLMEEILLKPEPAPAAPPARKEVSASEKLQEEILELMKEDRI